MKGGTSENVNDLAIVVALPPQLIASRRLSDLNFIPLTDQTTNNINII
jgi:hypothetical protein